MVIIHVTTTVDLVNVGAFEKSIHTVCDEGLTLLTYLVFPLTKPMPRAYTFLLIFHIRHCAFSVDPPNGWSGLYKKGHSFLNKGCTRNT